MYVAKVKSPDIGKAYALGVKIKGNELDNEKKEEAKKQTEASNVEFGNYLTENNPASVVQPTDENENGMIDAEENKNALMATGRKYKAHEEIRTDTEQSTRRKQVMAHAAASEGRRIRSEQRAIESHNNIQRRNREAENQLTKMRENARTLGKQLNLVGGELDNFVDMAVKDSEFAATAYEQLDHNERMVKTGETDETQKQIYLPTKAYTEAYKTGKPEDVKAANIAGITALDKTIEKMEGGLKIAIADKNIKKVKQIEKMIEEFKTLKGADGTFDFAASQKLSEKYAIYRANEKRISDNGEDMQIIKNYRNRKGSKSSKNQTADQKNAATYAEAKDTPKDKRTTEQQHVVSKNDKSKASGKSVVEEIDTYLGIQDYSSKEEKEEATKLKAKALKFWRKDKTLTAFEARELAVAETKKRSGNKLSNSKGSKGKKSLGKSTKEDGATAKTKDGRAVITENGQWVLK